MLSLRERVLLTFAVCLASWCIKLGRLRVIEGWWVILSKVEALRVTRLEQLVVGLTLKLERGQVRAQEKVRVLW